MLRPDAHEHADDVYRGMLREGHRPVYACTHDDHPARRAAMECARGALHRLHTAGDLPPGWVQYQGRARPP